MVCGGPACPQQREQCVLCPLRSLALWNLILEEVSVSGEIGLRRETESRSCVQGQELGGSGCGGEACGGAAGRSPHVRCAAAPCKQDLWASAVPTHGASLLRAGDRELGPVTLPSVFQTLSWAPLCRDSGCVFKGCGLSSSSTVLGGLRWGWAAGGAGSPSTESSRATSGAAAPTPQVPPRRAGRRIVSGPHVCQVRRLNWLPIPSGHLVSVLRKQLSAGCDPF